MGEEQDQRKHEERMQVWAFRRLIAFLIFGVIAIALLIPLAYLLGGKSTNVTINAAVTFSLVASLGAAITGTGWYRAHGGKNREMDRARGLELALGTLQDEVDELRKTLPTLEADSEPDKQEDETR